MKVSRISRIIVLSMVFLLCGSAAAFAAFSGVGSGTVDAPYIITTPEQLDEMRSEPAAYYKLDNDIDLSAYLAPGGAGYAKWSTAGWQPVGTTPRFTGVLDGNKHKITGLWINRSEEDNIGLFGAAVGATIKNLGVEVAEGKEIRGNRYVGGLVGGTFLEPNVPTSNGVTNCYVRGNVTGGDIYVGGLAGIVNSGRIEYSYTTGNVTGTSSNVGGLVGFSSLGSSIQYCYSMSNVRGNIGVGGLVGTLGLGTVTNSYTKGDVTGTANNTGGLVGYCLDSSIQYCYSTSNVSGNINVGGLVGSAVYNSSHITNCYVMGNVNFISGNDAGMVAGYFTSNLTTLINNYRYQNATLNGAARTENTPDGQHGGIVTASELRNRDTYTSLTSWSFSDTAWHWSGDPANGFPILGIGDEEYPFPFPAPAPDAYTVTFNSQGGSAVAPATGVPSGRTIARPTDPTRTGYTFTGWYRDAAATQLWNFDTDTVTASITLHAGWQLNTLPGTYTVTFNSQGGTAVSSFTVPSGMTISNPGSPLRAGYTFTNWYRDSAATQLWNFNTDTVTGNITLYAGWQLRNNFFGNGGGGGSGCSAMAAPMLIIFAALPLLFSRRKK